MAAVDHVVLGAGAVGMAVAEALARRGESVRVVNRSGLRDPVAGVQSAARKGRVHARMARDLMAAHDAGRATPLADAVEQTVRWYRAQATPSPAADHRATQPVAARTET